MKLKPCPDSPNCVSSQSRSDSQRINPLPYKTAPRHALARIKNLISAMPGAKLVREEENYLHFEFTTRIMKFVDDVEIALDKTEKQIHLRSASRVGYWDLGTNRRRLEKIRKKFLDSFSD